MDDVRIDDIRRVRPGDRAVMKDGNTYRVYAVREDSDRRLCVLVDLGLSSMHARFDDCMFDHALRAGGSPDRPGLWEDGSGMVVVYDGMRAIPVRDDDGWTVASEPLAWSVVEAQALWTPYQSGE